MMNQPSRIKLQVWVVISLVFVLGGVTGASLDRFYLAQAGKQPNRPFGDPGRPGAGRFLERLTKDLNLNSEQAESIRKILEESRKEFPPSKFQECPGFKEARQRTHDRINAVLTPEQRKLNDEITAQREAERESHMNGGSAPR
jgi:Spy/CpxP family protein refolding chaperone